MRPDRWKRKPQKNIQGSTDVVGPQSSYEIRERTSHFYVYLIQV